jgi:hypothetical protein
LIGTLPLGGNTYDINLDAPNKITASDGETRMIGVGEIILIEEVHGKDIFLRR